jgi:hypothetical protein
LRLFTALPLAAAAEVVVEVEAAVAAAERLLRLWSFILSKTEEKDTGWRREAVRAP